jgi:homoserine kinase
VQTGTPINSEFGRDREKVTVWGPATLSNLGPGFDTLGLCLSGWGDVIEVWREEMPGVRVEIDPHGVAWQAPVDPEKNTAVVAAMRVLRILGVETGIGMSIRKGIPPGSGVGSSAASAVAGAWAANVLLGAPLDKDALVDAVLEGEAVAAGSRHGDNVLPALFGGLVLASSSDPLGSRRVPLPRPLHLAVVLPSVQVLTRQARAILPREVRLDDAVHNASELAFMIDAFRAGDWETVGHCIMADAIVEPVRAKLVPCYESVRSAAMEAGALGCALSGSGPAMFALAGSATEAERIRDAMLAASRQMGIEARGIATEVDEEGVRTLE